MRPTLATCSAALLTTLAAATLLSTAGAQQVSGREEAPIDITGHWVSLITDDWVYRMIIPAKGDYSYVPLNAEGTRVADTWDPARDAAAGEQCKGYAAPSIMRLPARVEISWEDDDTLKLDIDTGMQSRLFRFNAGAPEGPRTLQGWSNATWELSGDIGRQLVFGGTRTSLNQVPVSGSLKVDTQHLLPGYLRRNGVPYSESAFMTEYYNLVQEEDGNQYLIIQTYVDDPVYLRQHWVRTLQFKRESNGSQRRPMDCAAADAISFYTGGFPRPDGR